MVLVTSGVFIRLIVICLEEPSSRIQFKAPLFFLVLSLSRAQVSEREKRVLAIELLRWGFH
jgi:hypothetical protein